MDRKLTTLARRPDNPPRRWQLAKRQKTSFGEPDHQSSIAADPCPIVLSSELVFPLCVMAVIESGLMTIKTGLLF
jgi:hypothetical protein